MGFRAPGYTVTPLIIETLTDLGYQYDASIVPSWSYTTLKQAFRFLARPEYRAFLVAQELACAGAPRLPYPIASAGLFAARPDAALLEIPLTTVGPLQFPFIHGLTMRLPDSGRRLVEWLAPRRSFFSLAFHDFEFADQADFGLLPVSDMTRPHLAVPIAARLARLTTLVESVQRTHAIVTMREVADRHARLWQAPAPGRQARGVSRP